MLFKTSFVWQIHWANIARECPSPVYTIYVTCQRRYLRKCWVALVARDPFFSMFDFDVKIQGTLLRINLFAHATLFLLWLSWMDSIHVPLQSFLPIVNFSADSTREFFFHSMNLSFVWYKQIAWVCRMVTFVTMKCFGVMHFLLVIIDGAPRDTRKVT